MKKIALMLVTLLSLANVSVFAQDKLRKIEFKKQMREYAQVLAPEELPTGWSDTVLYVRKYALPTYEAFAFATPEESWAFYRACRIQTVDKYMSSCWNSYKWSSERIFYDRGVIFDVTMEGGVFIYEIANEVTLFGGSSSVPIVRESDIPTCRDLKYNTVGMCNVTPMVGRREKRMAKTVERTLEEK